MSCKTPYLRQNEYVIVLDETGHRVVEYLNQHETCKSVFLRKLNMQYGLDLNSEYQIYVDGKRIR